MGSWGVKIAKKFHNVWEKDNMLIYNSKYPLLKILESGTGTATLSSTSDFSATIYTHNLGFKPMFYFETEYIDAQSGLKVSKMRRCSWRDYAGLQIYWGFRAYTDVSYLKFEISTTDDNTHEGVQLNYKWLLYYEEITA
jgi:hypothetical protein